MAAPLLGLASLIGREYANTLPTNKERDDFLKLVSPQTYYGNQLIQYIAGKINPSARYDLEDAQSSAAYAAAYPYRSQPGIDLQEEERLMADLSASVNRPGGIERFENYLRDLDFGTIDQNAQSFRGPQAEDSQAFQFGSDTFPVTVGQLPVESNFTPLQLEALERALVGGGFEVGPQPDVPDVSRNPDFTPQGGGSGFMPQGGDFMPGGYEKNPFETSYEDVEQYLRGGVVGRRRA
jgi:hypothetical protein